jgi:hypothetical protein
MQRLNSQIWPQTTFYNPSQEHALGRDGESINNRVSMADKGKEPTLEHFHTPGSLSNAISWGDQPIPEPVDEVVDVQAITYDRKRKVVVKRTSKKRRLTLDSVVVITMKETMLDAKQSKVSELLGVGMAISSATIDREREDEWRSRVHEGGTCASQTSGRVLSGYLMSDHLHERRVLRWIQSI